MNTILETLGTKVVIQPKPMATRIGSIILPQNLNEDKHLARATVLSVGPGKTLANGTIIPTNQGLEPGQEVLYRKYEGSEFSINGENYLVIEGKFILAEVAGEEEVLL